ncbi:APC family permease [Kocuria palustris]|uniref:APC family permease n=1 Tax=Kocuria palustris TaxID=71999 RepID=UPI00230067DB|nr:APC family permease [Kocuria palustris]
MSTNSRESAPSDPRGTSTDGTAPVESSDLAKVMGPGLLLLFIVGDILGTGVYALTGTIAGEIGGAAWAPILLAFFVAAVTAFSYLEMVTKYPGASGAALYTHKAFGIGLLTFMVTFAVLASGLTSASTAARTVASNLVAGFGWEDPPMTAVTLMAVGFMVLLMLINLRSVRESLMLNVVLTCIELSGLAIVILIGLWAATQGNADFSRTMIFETQGDKSIFLALTAVTSLAFFSFVGFEDSVNMVEETKDPQKNFPRIMLIGLCITGAVYVLVSILAVAIVPIGVLGESTTPLLEVVNAGAPGIPIGAIYPFLTIFAVANTALINMLMASRLLYGMASQGVLPGFLAKVSSKHSVPWASVVFTTVLAAALILVVGQIMAKETAAALGGTTALLLLGVFAVVNVAVIVLRKDKSREGTGYFRAPAFIPFIGAATTLFLIGPWAQDVIEYQIAAVLLGVGLLLSAVNWAYKRFVKHEPMGFEDTQAIATLGEEPGGHDPLGDYSTHEHHRK